MSSTKLNNIFSNLNNAELKSLLEFELSPQTSANNIKSLNLNNNYDYYEPKNIDKQIITTNTLSVLAINIRSLNKNFQKLQLLLNDLKFEPTLILVSETWVNENKPFIFNLKNYNFINQPSENIGGGAGIFIKKDINYSIINNYNLNLTKCEDIWINVQISTNKNIIISSIYRHPHHDIKQFQEILFNKFLTLNKSKQMFLLGGDININVARNCSSINAYLNDMLSNGIIQTVKSPTRIHKSTMTLIDHFYTNIPENQTLTKTLISDISDHLPILCLLNPFKIKNSKINRKLIRDLKKINYDKLNEDLKMSLDKIPYQNLNVSANELWGIFESTMNKIVDKHAPLKLQSRSNHKRSFSPWITNDILAQIKLRQRLHKKAIKHPSQLNQKNFKQCRNKTTRMIEQAKRSYYNNKISSVKSNPQKIWRTINNIINLKKDVIKTTDIIIHNDTNSTSSNDPKEISNEFNKFFTTIGSKLAQQIDPSTKSNNYVTPNQFHIKNSFFLKNITTYEVQSYISQINPNKANKSDCIPSIIIKNCSAILAPALTKLFNRCISEGVFPQKLKSAEVHPIFKKGNKQLITNYRPISILSPFSKLLERHIHTELTKFVTKHKILHQFQFGFRKNSSTEMALTQIIEEITNNMGNGKFTCSVFLDLAKAFDTVDHKILINKLYNYGVRGLPAKLIENYLTNRDQITIFNNIKSDKEQIKLGVPQGSILGPLLFNFYINDIVQVSNFTVRLFADDACLVYTCNSAVELENRVNTELIKINNWRVINKLSVNFSKSNYLIFNNNKTTHKFSINMDGNILEKTEDIKYLGVKIDHKLKWNKHVNYIKNKIAKASYILCKIRHYVNIQTLKMLYYSLVHPHLNYCLTAWGGAPNSTIKPLITLQKKILRIMTFNSYDHPSAELFLKLDILPLDQLYNLNLSILMYKIHHNQFTGEYKLTPINQIHHYKTRLSTNINYYTSTAKSNLGIGSFSNQGTKIWAKLPTNIKQLPIHLFKKSLKQYLTNSSKEQIT